MSASFARRGKKVVSMSKAEVRRVLVIKGLTMPSADGDDVVPRLLDATAGGLGDSRGWSTAGEGRKMEGAPICYFGTCFRTTTRPF